MKVYLRNIPCWKLSSFFIAVTLLQQSGKSLTLRRFTYSNCTKYPPRRKKINLSFAP